jgi:hypothetical protein
VILQPMGPVMFVFDVADTEPLPGAPPLPAKVERPFEVRRGKIGGELKSTVENAKSRPRRPGDRRYVRRQDGGQRLSPFRTRSLGHVDHRGAGLQ